MIICDECVFKIKNVRVTMAEMMAISRIDVERGADAGAQSRNRSPAAATASRRAVARRPRRHGSAPASTNQRAKSQRTSADLGPPSDAASKSPADAADAADAASSASVPSTGIDRFLPWPGRPATRRNRKKREK